ncbi:ABC transporter permease [Thalassospira lucentensis]|uniref:ABC transporter permease n=1 Tax=Thalassospira lucentensis TaxID=168935 RepID=UPI0004180E85|nr:FtsX-like permease family protein [Thalassospira lucentensis]
MSLQTSRYSQYIPASLRFCFRELRQPGIGLWSLFATLVFAITVLAVCTNLTQTIRDATLQSAQQTIGGDISLRLFHRTPTPEEIAFLERFGQLSLTAEQRIMVASENEGTSILAEMKAVDGTYPLYGDLVLSSNSSIKTALAAQDGMPGTIVASNFLDTLHLRLGDQVTLGGQAFIIRDVIKTEPERSFRLFSLGPRIIISSNAFQTTNLGTTHSQVYWYARLRLDPNKHAQSGQIIEAIETKFPDAGWRIVNATNGIPGIERINDFAMAFVSLIGIAIFVICATAMQNALRADLDQRQPRFAVLRSMGATRQQVLGAIAAQIGCVTLLALVTGGVLSLIIEYFAVPVFANMAELDIAVSMPASLSRFGAVALFVVLLITLISISPLTKASITSPSALFRHQLARHMALPQTSTKPRQTAISALLYGAIITALLSVSSKLIGFSWFSVVLIVGLICCLMLFAVISVGLRRGCRYLSTRPYNLLPSVRLALRNIARPGAPTLTVMTSIGLSVTCLMAVVLFAIQAGHHLTSTLPSDTPDLVFFDLPPEDGPSFRATAEAMAAVTGVDQMPFMHGRVTHINQTPISQINVPQRYQWFVRGDRGLSWTDHPHKAAQDNRVVTGEWWRTGHDTGRLASLDADIAHALGITVGDQITLNMLGNPQQVTIANLRKIDWTRLALDFPMVLSPPTEPIPHGLISTLDLRKVTDTRLDKAKTVTSVQSALQQQFPNVPTIRVQDVLVKLETLFDQVVIAMMALTLLATAGACLVVVSGLIALRQGTAQELAMLRALGVRPRQINSIAAWETGISVASSGFVGIFLGGGIATLAAHAIGAEVIAFPGMVAGGAILMVTLLGFGAGGLLQRLALSRQQGWRG